MKNFLVDDDLVALVWERANPRPFENLSFSEALRRVLTGIQQEADPNRKKSPPLSADELLAELSAMGKEFKITPRQRAPSPKAGEWVSSVPELRSVPNLRSWKDICVHLEIGVAGDSARRKLQDWVNINHPEWPNVPDA